MTNRPGRRPLPRRLLFVVVATAFVVAVVEAIAFAAFWLVDAQPFAYARLAAEQAAVADPAGDTTLAGGGQGSLLHASLHPYLGFVYHEANNTPAWRRATGRSVNRFGFNDDLEPLQKRSPGKVLVGIFGGSVAAWVGFDGGETLARELAATPRFRGKEVVVLTFAVGGYKQPQQLMALNWLLAQGGELDVAVSIDGFNECHLTPTNALAKIHPFFPALWPQLAGGAADRERLRRLAEVVRRREARRDLAAASAGSWRQASIAAQLVWRLRDRALANEAAAASRALAEHVPDEQSFEVRGPGLHGFDLDALPATVADLWQRCSLQMHYLCAANGIEFHHCLQPNQYVADAKPMDAAERAVAVQPGSLQELAVVLGYPALLARAEALRAAGVRFHDLRDVFADVAEPLYIDAFCHVNAAGSRRIAARIARAIGGS